jgi:hypothetical protein
MLQVAERSGPAREANRPARYTTSRSKMARSVCHSGSSSACQAAASTSAMYAAA